MAQDMLRAIAAAEQAGEALVAEVKEAKARAVTDARGQVAAMLEAARQEAATAGRRVRSEVEAAAAGAEAEVQTGSLAEAKALSLRGAGRMEQAVALIVRRIEGTDGS